MSEGNSGGGGIGIFGLLGVLFIGLKLTGELNWSWLWVLSPFWGGLLLWLVTVLIFAGIAVWAESKPRRRW